MNRLCRFTVTSALASLLLGCQGIPLNEIRKTTPMYTATSAKPLNAVFSCFTTELNVHEDSNVHVLTYPEESKAEFSIGAMQMGEFKHFYLISLARSLEGTRTDIQRSPTDYFPLPQTKMNEIAAKCTGTR